jgi:hypothetical protein
VLHAVPPQVAFSEFALGGSVPLASGAAAINVATLTAGTHSISAQYSGDSNYTSATAALSQVVNQATPGQGDVAPVTIASSNNPSSYGQSVTLSVTATGPGATPSGTVTVMDGSTTVGTITLDAAGKGALITSALTAGNHNLTFTYGGDANFPGGSESLTQRVMPAAATTLQLASSRNPSVAGDAIQLTATVAPNVATGTVTFTISQNGSAVESHFGCTRQRGRDPLDHGPCSRYLPGCRQRIAAMDPMGPLDRRRL